MASIFSRYSDCRPILLALATLTVMGAADVPYPRDVGFLLVEVISCSLEAKMVKRSLQHDLRKKAVFVLFFECARIANDNLPQSCQNENAFAAV